MPIVEHPTSMSPSSDNDDWLSALNEKFTLTVEDADAMIARASLQKKSGDDYQASLNWSIGAYVDSGENEEINAYAKEEVAGGAEALLFRLYQQPDADDIAQLLEDIAIEKLSLHCTLRYPGQDPAELFRDLVRYLRRKDYDLRGIAGSVDFDPLLDWSEPPFPPLIRLLYFVSRWMPRFRVLQVNAAGFNNGIVTADAELALAIAKGAEYLKQIEALNYPAALANNHLQFAITVGSSFYGDVAKLRALRVLWDRVLKNLGINDAPATEISAHTDVALLTSDATDTLQQIRLQALSAAHGGADIVFLAPADGAFLPATAQGRKQALQTQLDIRSGALALDASVINEDFLDAISSELVSAAWQRYQNIEKQGGFASAVEF